MKKTIVELITSEESVHAVTVVEKTLSKKLLEALSNHRSIVAKDVYGTLGECYGADETPEFMEPADNAYQIFYQNALKKFGVNGPQDFQDMNTRDQFFNYLDQNWKAQDSVQQQQVPGMGMQQPMPGMPQSQMPGQGTQAPMPQGGNVDLGTQTQLPAQAAQPMAPQSQQPAQAQSMNGVPAVGMGNQQMPMGGANDPSVATMAPAGPSVDKTAPLGPDGDDNQLDGIQNTQGRMGNNDPTDQNQQQQGMQAMGGADQFGNGADNDDQDPNLEIGDEDGQQNQFGDEEDEQQGNGNGFDMKGDNEGEGDEDVPGAGQEDDNQDDDPFADDDAYTADHNDFMPKGKGKDKDDESDDDDDSGDDSDDDNDGNDSDDDNDGDDSDDDDDDPDLDIDDDDDSDDDDDEDSHSKFSPEKKKAKSGFPPKKEKTKHAFGESLKPSDRSRKTRKVADAKTTRLAGKKVVKVHEGEDGEIEDGVTFGEAVDFINKEDEKFITEGFNFWKKAKKSLKTDPNLSPEDRHAQLQGVNSGMKKHGMIQKQLDHIRAGRDAILKMLRKQREQLKASYHGSELQDKLKKLSGMGKQQLVHSRQMAMQLKGIHSSNVASAMAEEKIVGTVTHVSGRSMVHIKEEAAGQYSSRMYINSGETQTSTTAKHKTLTGARRWAENAMRRHHNE